VEKSKPIDPAIEEILGLLADASSIINELPAARHYALARTHVQEAILWLLSDQVIDQVHFTNKKGVPDAKA